MNAQVPSSQAARPSWRARDLQAQLYRDIGISAVAAALRFTTLPDPTARPVVSDPARTLASRGSLAA